MQTEMLSGEGMQNSCGDDISCDEEPLNAPSEGFENRTKISPNFAPQEKKDSWSKTLTLYSGFDDLFGSSVSGHLGNSLLSKSPPSNASSEMPSSEVNEQDISSHLKGALAFGLPTKGNRIVKSYAEKHRPVIKMNPIKRNATSGGGGLTVHRPARKKEPKKVERKEVEKPNIDHLSEELQLGYRILADLMADGLKGCNGPFMEVINLDPQFNKDYLLVIKDPMWLPKIKEKLLGSQYESITELFTDLRTMLENAYRYFGPAHSFTKKGLRLEFVMEQKIALLPREIRELCSIEKTNGILPEEQKEIAQSRGAKKTIFGDVYFSYLLYRVRGFRLAREKELKRQKTEYLRQAKINKELEVLSWEEDMVAPHLSQMKAMWELPQIGQFVYLSLPALNIGAVPQYELERGLMLPEASMTMRMLMTSLVSSPVQRLKIAEKPYMPYKIWARKLANKVMVWYRAYVKEKKDPKKIYDQLGIEPTFWKVCGEESPFRRFLFHEMTFYQRIWLVKSLCDFIGHNHKSVQDTIMEQPEETQREEVLGLDKENKEYIYFPQFVATDLRIYKRTKVTYVLEESDHSDDDKPLLQLQDEKIFSKDQVRAFRALLKDIQRKQEKDDDWERSYRKKKRRKKMKKSAQPKVSAPTVTPQTETRTRPGNLRQRPRTRYSEELFLPAEMFDSPAAEETSSDSCNEGENLSSSEENEASLTRSKVKNIIKRRGRQQRPTCNVCGKVFAAIAGLNGHMTIHTKAKSSKSSREGTPKPRKESSPVESETQEEAQKERNDDKESDSEGKTLAPPETNEQPLKASLESTLHKEDPPEDCSTPKDRSEGTPPAAGEKGEDVPAEEKMETEILKEEPPPSDVSEGSNTKHISIKMEGQSTQGIQSECSLQLKEEEQEDQKPTAPKEEVLDRVKKEFSSWTETNGIKAESEEADSKSFQKALKRESDVDSFHDEEGNSVNCASKEEEKPSSPPPKGSTEADSLNESSMDPPQEPHIGELSPESGLSCPSTKDQDDANSPKTSSNYTQLLNEAAQDGPVKDQKSPTRSPPLDAESREPSEEKESPPRSKAEDLCQVHPDLSHFELIASTIDELRSLILQFGPLPSKNSKEEKEAPQEAMEESSQQDQDEDKEKDSKSEKGRDEEMEVNEKLDCEVQLHKALCALLTQLAPLDSKLKASHKQLRKKLWQEYSDWCKRDPSYVDPDEEAWLSEPEPEPSPPPPEPKPSSSSSSSDEEYNEDGIRKRKLRKRKAKKLSTPVIEEPVPSLAQMEEDSDAVTVSSRGRVRRIKKILNYDSLDFDKLAQQAEKEALEEKEKRKRKKEEEEEQEERRNPEKQLKVAADNLNLPSSGVRRYILSKNGRVVGYISNDGHFHSSSGETQKQLASKETYVSPTRPIKAAKEKRPSMISPSPATNVDNDKVPTILVAAQNKGGLVYVKINGIQALQLSKLLTKAKGMPPRQVKLQRSDQIYTFTSDSKILTRNIPGFPDCDLTIPPQLPTIPVTSQNPTALPERLPVNSPPAYSRAVLPKSFDKQQSSENSVDAAPQQQRSIPTNTLALAYQGIPGLHSRMASSSSRGESVKPQVTSCASLTASTQLVSASPSVVPSVTPFTYSKQQNPTSLVPTPVTQAKVSNSANLQPSVVTTMTSSITPTISSAASSQTLVTQTGTGGQVQMLAKLGQQTGQKLVAFPNGKGGYTLTLIAANSESARRPAPISSSPPVNNSPLRGSAPTKPTLVSIAPSSTTGTDKRTHVNLSHSTLLSPTKLPAQSQPLPTTVTESPSYEPSKAIVQNAQLQIGSNHTIAQANNQDKILARNPQSNQSLRSSNQIVHIDSSGLLQQGQQQIAQVQQPQQQQQQQQQPQRVLQIVQSGNRQIFQLVQPVIVSESSNSTIAVPSSTISTMPQNSVQSTGYLVQPQSNLNQKQSAVVQQPRIILQTSPQQGKYVQIAKPEQILQQSMSNNQVVQQQVIIHQPQTQHIVLQQPSVFSKGTNAYSTVIQENGQGNIPNQTVVIQPAHGHLNPSSQTVMLHQGTHLEPQQQVVVHHNPPLDQTANTVLQQTPDIGSPQNVLVQQAPHTNTVIQQVVQQGAINQPASQVFIGEQQASTPSSNACSTHMNPNALELQHQTRVEDNLTAVTQQSGQVVGSPKAILLQQALQAGSNPPPQQVKPPQKPVSNVQQGRLIVLQTTEGQKVCYQSSDGRLSLLTAEQLQPLIKNGTIKIAP